MPSATSSGADAGSGGTARAREHNQGNQDRKYTPDQKAAVLRIRQCNATAFYEILELETKCSDGAIKKAYHKQSLLTHPDKNGHEHAAEAFKMVSRAFSVLGNKEKREKFDRFGTDPDSRFESQRAQAGANPFSGFGGGRAASGGGPGAGGGGGGMWEDEISPEEMFQRFFGGAFGGPFRGGGPFDTGPQFVFNVGGNRNFRVHQFGGGQPRRRPRDPQQPQTGWDTLVGLLPILFLFLFPLLTSLFSGGESQPAVPNMAFDGPLPPLTHHRTTPRLHVDYYVDPHEVAGWSDYKFKQLDKEAEVGLVRLLRRQCDTEMRTKQYLVDQASGWFFQDPDKMKIARDFEMSSCHRLDSLGVSR
ncbi:Uu.00g075920.m01.CDS01 [Anthostomella pinea]|uniref:Uu.00g075920.m01.CDS01 n=1 Tax=Anthostomella pinea TaxID=933095 RepID=A0AAI8VVS2_9PEZI|nr:Uu.00g075920.m01.CDS01 [Anthostomella pinea]